MIRLQHLDVDVVENDVIITAFSVASAIAVKILDARYSVLFKP